MKWRWACLAVGALLTMAGRPAGLLLVAGALLVAYHSGVRVPGKAAAGCAFGKEMARQAGGALTPGPGKPHTSRQIANHEAGHVLVGRAVGLRVTEVSVGRGWGWTGISKWSKDPVKNIAFLLGGRYATGSGSGCSYDDSVIKSFLKKVPADQRKKVMAEARSIAKGATGWGSGVSSTGKTIYETGKL